MVEIAEGGVGRSALKIVYIHNSRGGRKGEALKLSSRSFTAKSLSLFVTITVPV
jgi:hypothetical protein